MSDFIDTHTHIYLDDFAADRDDVIRRAQDAGATRLLLPNIDEASLESMLRLCAEWPSLCCPMIGLHPTELPADPWPALKRMEHRLSTEAGRFVAVGEVGLDFGCRGGNTQELQIAAFEGICRAIAKHPLPHRVISVHAIHAATTALDILERTGVAGADARPGTSVIFHWFSGSSEEFARARRLGCYFSVSEHMLKSKRGREYARQLPEGRLLLETDAPPGLDAPYSADALEASLTRALATIAELRRVPQDALGHTIATTSAALLHLG